MNLNPSPVLKISNENLNGISIQERNLLGKINLRGKSSDKEFMKNVGSVLDLVLPIEPNVRVCLLYTSPSPRDRTRSRMPSSA